RARRLYPPQPGRRWPRRGTTPARGRRTWKGRTGRRKTACGFSWRKSLQLTAGIPDAIPLLNQESKRVPTVKTAPGRLKITPGISRCKKKRRLKKPALGERKWTGDSGPRTA